MKYGDCVKVTSGFYEGMEGVVSRKPIKISLLYCGEPIDKDEYYIVRLGNDNDIHEGEFPESSLELTK